MARKNLSIRLAAENGKAVEDSFSRIGNKGQKAFERIARATRPASAGLKAVDASARALNGVLRQATGLVAAYAGLHGVLSSIHSIAETGMGFQGVGVALEAITGSSASARKEMAFLREESERLGLNLLEVSKGYMKITAAAKGTVLAGKDTREIFTAVAEASTVLHMSVDQTNGVITAISQMMSKGKVSAEELRRQLGDRLYGAFQIAARATDKTTTKLDQMLKAGTLISEDFLPNLLPKSARHLAKVSPRPPTPPRQR